MSNKRKPDFEENLDIFKRGKQTHNREEREINFSSIKYTNSQPLIQNSSLIEDNTNSNFNTTFQYNNIINITNYYNYNTSQPQNEIDNDTEVNIHNSEDDQLTQLIDQNETQPTIEPQNIIIPENPIKIPSNIKNNFILNENENFKCKLCNGNQTNINPQIYSFQSIRGIQKHLERKHYYYLVHIINNKQNLDNLINNTLDAYHVFCDHLGCKKVLLKKNINEHYRIEHHKNNDAQKEGCLRCKWVEFKNKIKGYKDIINSTSRKDLSLDTVVTN